MSFLPLLEDSINTNEAEVTIKFDQLLNYLRQIPEFSVRNGFLKNLDLLKQSIKIERNIPDLDQISSLFHCLFSIKYFFFLITKYNSKIHKNRRKSSDGIKSFFLKSKILLVWLVSVYEIFTTKSLENFVTILYLIMFLY